LLIFFVADSVTVSSFAFQIDVSKKN